MLERERERERGRGKRERERERERERKLSGGIEVRGLGSTVLHGKLSGDIAAVGYRSKEL